MKFNGRNFEEDLKWFASWIMECRMRGQRSRSMYGRLMPFFPPIGEFHRLIDLDDGCPNQPTTEEAHAFVAQRYLWVVHLRDELRKMFPGPPLQNEERIQ